MIRFLLMLMVAAGLSAVEGLTTVSAEIPWPNPERYVPVVVRVQSNLGGPFRVTATLGQHSAVVEVGLDAGVPRTVTVLVPATADLYPTAMVRWTGPGDTRDSLSASCSAPRLRAIAVVDRDESVPLKRFAFVDQRASTHRASSGGLAERVALDLLPQRWQGYPSHMVLLFSPSDDRRLDDERRGAIATWVGVGGALAVVEAGQVPAWRAVGVEPIVLDARNDDRELRARVEADGSAHRDPPVLTPVPGTERVPATGFVLVALLFAVVAGPLNFWWVRKRGSRHLLLVTTPIISLATCACLLIVNLLIEGVALHRSVLQLTLLDQRRAQAVAWTRATYYGGFAVSSMAVDAEGCARDFAADEHQLWSRRHSGAIDPLAIDWRDGKRLAGWIPARTNRQLLFTMPRPERRRLTVERVGSGWLATNGLEVGIETLTWRDSELQTWRAGQIAYGASATLNLVTPESSDQVNVSAELDASAQRAQAKAAEAPFGFIAKLDAPFGTLPGPAARDALPPTCVVIGLAIPSGATP